MDLLLRQFGDQRHHGADHVWGLEGSPDRELTLDLVKGADALAGLQRRRMGAVIGDHLLDRHLRLVEGGIRQLLVADAPLEDVVVVLARTVGATRLPARSSRKTGASAAIALKGSTSTGSGSYSTITLLMPSSAA